jgi:hypothetical protein
MSYVALGDAFADLFCFMSDGFPPAGGDVRVKHPSKYSNDICFSRGGLALGSR